ncbi:MAG: hypothetical protein H6715_06015 [Myxococcales bacterium]|nr:hypothetical protein [Myxococcales bacterium]MCB9708333.1 hypothetical protein [Myxococcales bacterium]
MKRLIPVLALALVGCAGSGPAQAPETHTGLNPSLRASGKYCGFPAPRTQKVFTGKAISHVSRLPTATELRAMRPLLVIASNIRGLPLKKPIDIRVQNQAAIRHYLSSQIKVEDLKEASAIYGALGLLDEDTDLGALLLDVLSEQVVGYYDPEHRYLVVRDDVLSGLATDSTTDPGESHAVLIHEIVHALQDQHLALGKLHKLERSSDADGAFQSLVEGDATLAMLAFLGERAGVNIRQLTDDPNILRAVLTQVPMSTMPSDVLSRSPEILRVLLLSPYIDGLIFSASLYREGGWQALNAAYRHLPTTTSQILHPEHFLKSDAPAASKFAPFPPRLPGGYRLVYSDALGELTWRVYLGQVLPNADAEQRASAWRADRIAIYQDSHARLSAAWLSRWSSVSAAKSVQEATAKVEAKSAPRVCRTMNRSYRNGDHFLSTRALSDKAAAVLARSLLR